MATTLTHTPASLPHAQEIHRPIAWRKWQLPPTGTLQWQMKPLASAQTTMRILANGERELTIQHDVIKGVTPAMLHWWFCHIDGTMRVAGKPIPAITSGIQLIISTIAICRWQPMAPAAAARVAKLWERSMATSAT